MLETTQERARAVAEQASRMSPMEAREEFGRRAFDVLEQYFPEAAADRRRTDRWEAWAPYLVVGVVVGFALRGLLQR